MEKFVGLGFGIIVVILIIFLSGVIGLFICYWE